MAKRIKKPPIKAEERREWLRRNEEDGESISQIAAKDSFDIRTVRKQVDLARAEREMREARTIFLRNTVAKHYDDLRQYAERLDKGITEGTEPARLADDEFIESALKQHLPRSPIWHYLSRHNQLKQTEDEQRHLLKELIEKIVKSHPGLNTLAASGFDEIIPAVIALLLEEYPEWLKGDLNYTLTNIPTYTRAGVGLTNPGFGSVHFGEMKEDLVKKIMLDLRKTVLGFELSVKNSPVYHDLERTLSDLSQLNRKLREELAVIRLKRIVPGRCKFCPL